MTKYRKGYEYQLLESCRIRTGLKGYAAEVGPIKLHKNGVLVLQQYFAWDGPSGPPRWLRDIPVIGWMYRPLINTLLKASLVHDALYELLRHELLPKPLRNEVDWEFYKITRESGTNWLRARLALWAVRRFGRFAVVKGSKSWNL